MIIIGTLKNHKRLESNEYYYDEKNDAFYSVDSNELELLFSTSIDQSESRFLDLLLDTSTPLSYSTSALQIGLMAVWALIIFVIYRTFAPSNKILVILCFIAFFSQLWIPSFLLHQRYNKILEKKFSPFIPDSELLARLLKNADKKLFFISCFYIALILLEILIVVNALKLSDNNDSFYITATICSIITGSLLGGITADPNPVRYFFIRGVIKKRYNI